MVIVIIPLHSWSRNCLYVSTDSTHLSKNSSDVTFYKSEVIGALVTECHSQLLNNCANQAHR